MPGPSPKPDAIRRNAPSIEWVGLPESGNPNPAPPMPSGPDWSLKTRDLWIRLWHSPQSLMWSVDTMPLLERLMYAYEQIYETAEVQASMMAAIDRIEDKLGLNPKALVQLRWRIVPDHLATVGPDAGKPVQLAAVQSLKPKRRRDIDY